MQSNYHFSLDTIVSQSVCPGVLVSEEMLSVKTSPLLNPKRSQILVSNIQQKKTIIDFGFTWY